MTGTGNGTGEAAFQTDCVGRRGHIAYSGNAFWNTGNYLIHTGYDNYVAGPLNQTGNTVAVAVHVELEEPLTKNGHAPTP